LERIAASIAPLAATTVASSAKAVVRALSTAMGRRRLAPTTDATRP
jgi:hypothetical protein